jgi:hypothetical protein
MRRSFWVGVARSDNGPADYMRMKSSAAPGRGKAGAALAMPSLGMRLELSELVQGLGNLGQKLLDSGRAVAELDTNGEVFL